MKRHYTDAEIRDKLKTMTIICDTREQQNGHIVGYFDSNRIPHISRKLSVGDYSLMLDDCDFSDEVVIEKKNSIDEIAGNFTVDRQRFENEFLRAKAAGVKVFLLIEDASYSDIESHNYRSKLQPKALLGSLLSWQVKFNITIVFCKQFESGNIIYGILYYWLKSYLEGGARNV
ncbi:MAG: hypothetical protein GX625_19845 [Clostridiaceae bacterium]|nr:hypothetical protein [Clostridiaceae bacterium]